jgi:hypothetical protein
VYARGRLAEQRKAATAVSVLSVGARAFEATGASSYGAGGVAAVPQYTQEQMLEYMQQQMQQMQRAQGVYPGGAPAVYAGAPAAAPARDTAFTVAEWRFGDVPDSTGAPRTIPSVTYVTDASDTGIQIWLEEHAGPECEVLGFDVTWRPSREPPEGQIALLQLATERAILVVHLAHMKTADVTTTLRDILYQPTPLLVGYGATRHAERLVRCCNMTCGGVVDVGDAACGIRRREQGTPGSRRSLSELAQEFLGQTTTAAPADFSDRLWERTPLSRIERWFAAEGAWVSIATYVTLCAQWGAPTVREVAAFESRATFRPSSSPTPPSAAAFDAPSWSSLSAPRRAGDGGVSAIAPQLPNVQVYSSSPTWTERGPGVTAPSNPAPLW